MHIHIYTYMLIYIYIHVVIGVQEGVMCQEQAAICTNQTDGHGTRCVHTDAPPPAPVRTDTRTRISLVCNATLC